MIIEKEFIPPENILLSKVKDVNSGQQILRTRIKNFNNLSKVVDSATDEISASIVRHIFFYFYYVEE